MGSIPARKIQHARKKHAEYARDTSHTKIGIIISEIGVRSPEISQRVERD